MISVGIGRALDPEWLQDASGSFNSNLGVDSALQNSRMPGIIYVSPEELLVLANGSASEDAERVVSHVDLLIGSIATALQTSVPTVTEPVDLGLKSVGIRGHKNAMTLRAKFRDSRFSAYTPIWMIEMERRTFRQELGLRVSRTSGSETKTPSYWVNLGASQKTTDATHKAHIVSRVESDVPKTGAFSQVGAVLF